MLPRTIFHDIPIYTHNQGMMWNKSSSFNAPLGVREYCQFLSHQICYVSKVLVSDEQMEDISRSIC